MELWQSLAFTETEQLLELAPICEELGFDGVLVSDHQVVRANGVLTQTRSAWGR